MRPAYGLSSYQYKADAISLQILLLFDKSSGDPVVKPSKYLGYRDDPVVKPSKYL